MVIAPSYVQAPAFQPRPLADGGVFEDARVMRTWGARSGLVGKGPGFRGTKCS